MIGALVKHGVSGGANTYKTADGAYYVSSHLWTAHPNGQARRGVRYRVWNAYTVADTDGVAREVVSADSLKALKVRLAKYIAKTAVTTDGVRAC